MSIEPRVHRVVELVDPTPLRVEFHGAGCSCCWCVEAEIDAAATLAAEQEVDAFVRAGWLALWGILIGSAIAFAIDAHGAWAALASLAGAR